MKVLLIIASVIGLLLTIVPSILVFTGHMSTASQKNAMTYGMLIWLATAPFWMKEQEL